MLRVSLYGPHYLAWLKPDINRWGQVYILDSLLSFVPTSHMDAETLAERISVRLQHANSAVVLTTIKVIMYLTNYMEDEVLIRALERKMGPPLGELSRRAYRAPADRQ